MLSIDDLKKGDWFSIMGRFGTVRFVAHFDGLLVFEDLNSLKVVRIYPDTKFYSVVESLKREVQSD